MLVSCTVCRLVTLKIWPLHCCTVSLLLQHFGGFGLPVRLQFKLFCRILGMLQSRRSRSTLLCLVRTPNCEDRGNLTPDRAIINVWIWLTISVRPPPKEWRSEWVMKWMKERMSGQVNEWSNEWNSECVMEWIAFLPRISERENELKNK